MEATDLQDWFKRTHTWSKGHSPLSLAPDYEVSGGAHQPGVSTLGWPSSHAEVHMFNTLPMHYHVRVH